MKDQRREVPRRTHSPLLSVQANEQESMGGPSFQAPALQLLWQGVTSDPMDFQSWTALLSQAKVADILVLYSSLIELLLCYCC